MTFWDQGSGIFATVFHFYHDRFQRHCQHSCRLESVTAPLVCSTTSLSLRSAFTKGRLDVNQPSYVPNSTPQISSNASIPRSFSSSATPGSWDHGQSLVTRSHIARNVSEQPWWLVSNKHKQRLEVAFFSSAKFHIVVIELAIHYPLPSVLSMFFSKLKWSKKVIDASSCELQKIIQGMTVGKRALWGKDVGPFWNPIINNCLGMEDQKLN